MGNIHNNIIYAVLVLLLVMIATGCNDNGSSNSVPMEPSTSNTSEQSNSISRTTTDGQELISSSNINHDVGIHVTGAGVITVEPDIAVLSVSIETTNKSLSISSIKNAKSTELVLKVLKANDVNEEDIKTQRYSTQPVYKYTQEEGQKLQGYKVTNSLQITLRTISNNIGPIIDELVSSAGNDIRINQINFRKEDTSSALRQARILAAQNAIEIAELYALEMGLTRWKLLYVVDQNSSRYPEKDSFAMAEAGLTARSTPTTIIPGGYDITATIRVVFAIN